MRVATLSISVPNTYMHYLTPCACFLLQENYFGACGAEADPSTSLTCRLNANALRWAAGVPAPSGNGTAVASLRLAITSGLLNTAEITAIKTAIVRDTADLSHSHNGQLCCCQSQKVQYIE